MLGPHVSTHRSSSAAQRRALRAWSYVRRVGLLAVCGALALALARADWRAFPGLGGLGVAILMGGWAMVQRARGASAVEVRVHRGGLTVDDMDGHRSVLWRDVAQLQVDAREHKRGRGRFRFDFGLRDGERFRIDVRPEWMERPHALVTDILATAGSELGRRARERIRTRSPIVCGPLTVRPGVGVETPHGIRPWSRIGTLTVSDGYVEGRHGGQRWFRRRVRDVPNLSALLEALGNRVPIPPRTADWIWTWGD